MLLPAPAIDTIPLDIDRSIYVVRDDLLPGGTKRRAIPIFFDDDHDEYVYASPVQGAAQLALAHTARVHGKKATIVCAARQRLHTNTAQCIALGASIIEVPGPAFLTVVQARARAYAALRPRCKLLPFGLDTPEFIKELATVALQIDFIPREVWSITASGVLSRALKRAWPYATFYGIQVGHTPIADHARVYQAPERFEQDAKHPPPFPSCSNYDAKAWRFIIEHASDGALFWNVA